ncbi:hypothetical protein HMF8227_02981 [Saliniradius amylolyticus]|uniref:HTH cro/C1-type domain-containing protein n=1 Tax=Saliniradius amylolyticus TaxID=2183582 RepID=A0A2S2E737_9ALTE|nr:helix-turn-helix transcriptional regulator [Saliniradius amylolyticus]AWL13429.1 hypothetical protein HMF8227_02981 [Saliniradius amylolyticus]
MTKLNHNEQNNTLILELLSLLYSGDLTSGELLKTLRKELMGLSQLAFAEQVGISRRTLIALEQDKASPTLQILNAAFKPFGLKYNLVAKDDDLMHQLIQHQHTQD